MSDTAIHHQQLATVTAPVKSSDVVWVFCPCCGQRLPFTYLYRHGRNEVYGCPTKNCTYKTGFTVG